MVVWNWNVSPIALSVSAILSSIPSASSISSALKNPRRVRSYPLATFHSAFALPWARIACLMLFMMSGLGSDDESDTKT
ncbi:hypothetical protein EDD85DRAFT_810337 [Armillaria nabsnona]|nr:hypothetical protein EDD85DRAFT_810337 [Armillaria nabsnona]